MERLVAMQPHTFLNSKSLFNLVIDMPSSGTALLRVLNDLPSSPNGGFLNFLFLSLNLSAAFDTVNHDALVSPLSSLAITDITPEWVRVYPHKSFTSPVTCGVPQGSVLRPFPWSDYL